MKDYFKLPSGSLPKTNIKKLPKNVGKRLPKFSDNKNLGGMGFGSSGGFGEYKMDIMKDIMSSQDHIKHDVSNNYKNMTSKLPRSSMGLPKISGRIPKATGRYPKANTGMPSIFGGLNLSNFDDSDTDMDEAYDGFSEGKKKFNKQTRGTNLTSKKSDIKFGRSGADLGWGKIAKKPTKGMFDGF